ARLILSDRPIELNLPAGISIDVLELAGDTLDPHDCGPLLDGIEPLCSPEFSTWLLVERTRIAALIDEKIRRDALRALALEDYESAIALAKLGVSRDMFNEGAHVLLVKGLAL